jgi:DNA-directed RNA polymerase specialized sigma24 family protein
MPEISYTRCRGNGGVVALCGVEVDVEPAVGGQPSVAEFATFMRSVEPALHRALIAAYGPTAGREAALDALSWAWEHWDRLAMVSNRAGYLFRVGQTAARRNRPPRLPGFARGALGEFWSVPPEIEPRLIPALARLSVRQRTVVVLVHGFGWSQADVASMLDMSASTVHEHLQRALRRLAIDLEVDNGE